VGEQWHTQRIPDFNLFHEKETNQNGGVVICVGKHLKASKVEINMVNIVVVDISGLNEPLRVIGIYWPDSKGETSYFCTLKYFKVHSSTSKYIQVLQSTSKYIRVH
jgi:hypothetical protein